MVSASAQTTVTWSGLGPLSGNYSTFKDASNWVGGVAPVNGDNLVFGPASNQSISLAVDFTAGNITFSGIQDGYYLDPAYSPEPAILTLNGDVSTTGGAQYWGLFGLPVNLAAGNHTYTTGGNADLYHFAEITGTGGIIKNGPNSLYLTESSTYTGGTVLNSGTLAVGSSYALGYGTVTLNGGTLSTAYVYDDITLGNNFVFGADVNFSTSQFFSDEPAVSLTLGNGDDSTITPVSGVTTVNLNLTGDRSLYLAGAMQDGASPTTYTFASGYGSPSYILSGYNEYTGGTVVHDGSSVIFDLAGAIPEEGLITTETNAYAGLGDNSFSADEFIGYFNPATTAGTIGFDNGYTYTGDLDLSGFSQADLSIGTLTSATLTGAITPPTGSTEYRFAGSGTLILQGSNPLTDDYDLHAFTLGNRSPFMLVLGQSAENTYTGITYADKAGIVFDSDSSLPADTSLQLYNSAYISVTDASGYTLGDLIGKFGGATNGAIGYDSSSYINGTGYSGTSYSGPVDFSSLSQPVYLGSATATTVYGTITTTNAGGDDYYFTGYNGGTLTVASDLAGSRGVHIGLPGVYQDPNNGYAYSNVTLSSDNNTYTGDTVLNSGYLQITNPGAIGPGNIVVNASGSDNSVAFEGPNNSTFANNINLSSGLLYLNGYNLTLSGNISGGGRLWVNDYIVLAGNNTYSGGTLVDYSRLTATTNTALGTGPVELTNGGSISFDYTTAPVIGSLLRGEGYYGEGTTDAAIVLAGDGGSQTLTINQQVDGNFFGAILEDGVTGSLVKTGPATLTIYGDHDDYTPYSGGTTITQGKLVAQYDGALGSGPIILNGGSLGTAPGVTLANPISFGASGGKLTGNVTFNNPIVVGTNAILSPGNSPGTMTFAAGLTLAGGGSLDFEVQSAAGAAGTGYDLVSITGGSFDITATSGSPFTIRLLSLTAAGGAGNVSDFSAGTGYSWMLFESNVAGGINTFAADKFLIDASGFTNGLGGGVFSLTEGINGGNPALFLNFSPVPEPSTYALLGIGLGAMGLTRLRRRRS